MIIKKNDKYFTVIFGNIIIWKHHTFPYRAVMWVYDGLHVIDSLVKFLTFSTVDLQWSWIWMGSNFCDKIFEKETDAAAKYWDEYTKKRGY